MQRLGFIHDMMDVKVLILYAMARSNYPMTSQDIYEVCYQDDCLSYFDVCTAIPELIKSGHLQQVEDEKYVITEKGRQDGEITADSIAFTVKLRTENAVARYNRQVRRSSFVKTQIIPRPNDEFSVMLSLDDESYLLFPQSHLSSDPVLPSLHLLQSSAIVVLWLSPLSGYISYFTAIT